jgi:hypothetical protein
MYQGGPLFGRNPGDGSHWTRRDFAAAALLFYRDGRHEMSIGTILLILLILLLVGAIPAWPHSRGWGYGPSGGLGLVVVILLILVLMGKL